MRQIGTFLAAGLALCAATGQAAAETVTVRDNPVNGASVFYSGLGRTVSIEFNGAARSVGAGAFGLQFYTGSEWRDFISFCLDLNEWLVLPSGYGRVDDETFFSSDADRTATGALYNNLLTAEFGLKDATSAAALQSIIWEIREDGAANFDLEGGAFRLVSADVLLRAQSLWGLIVSGKLSAPDFDVFTARGTQDLLVSEVPLPAAFILFGAGLAGLGAVRRKRRA
jgi:hypothetical protein